MRKPPIYLVILVAATCFVLTQGFSYVSQNNTAVVSTRASTEPVAIAALGRLEPAGEVIHVSAGNRTDAKIRRVLVREGEAVRLNQPIAYLLSDEIDRAAVVGAQREVQLYRARLEQLKAPPKSAGLRAQDARIARLSDEAEKAKKDSARYEYLFREGAVSEMAYDDFRIKYISKLKEVEGARSDREAMIEVRAADIAVSQSEIASAEARLVRALAQSENDIVRAPISGTVLCVNTRSGERENSAGICDLGAISQMYAKIDVCESDIASVALGQRVAITGECLKRPLRGVVARIGNQMVNQTVMSTDAAADVDRRVTHVWIRIDAKDLQTCRAFTNAVVEAKFL